MATLLALPLITRSAINAISTGHTARTLADDGLWLVGLGVVRAFAGGLRKYQAAKLMSAVGADARQRLHDHVQRLSFSFHDRMGIGQLLARCSSDVTVIEGLLSMLPIIVQSVALGIGGAVLLVVLKPSLGAIVVAVTAGLAGVTLVRARPLGPIARAVQDRVGAFAQFVEQQIGGIRVVKGHGFEAVHRQQGRRVAADIHASGLRLARGYALFSAALMTTPAAATFVVISFGGWLGSRGSLSAGTLFAFVQYLGVLMTPVTIGAQAVMLWPSASAGAARIGDVLSTDPEVAAPAHPRPLPQGPGTIRFEHVRFGYQPGQSVLDDFDLLVPGGTAVALVGASGAGKSTAALLIPRFYDPIFGAVLIDGVPVREFEPRTLRRAVSMVFEDTVVFSASIRENLLLGARGATDADMRRAARLAQADDFISALPHGYDTMVGENGASLSGGQRQRLAIARAILRDPRVLILDDATSAVDPATDSAIRDGLAAVMEGRTTVVIAHRPETLTLVDRVVLLDNGRVVAEGPHRQLLGLPAYREALGLEPQLVQEAS